VNALPKPPIRVLVADDHPVLREGIASLLEDEPDISLVGEAFDGRDALGQWLALRPDVTLMDIQMPVLEGIAALQAIRAVDPAARVVMLTTYARDAQARRALQAGAAGYLLKSMLRHELVDTLRKVHAGQRAIPVEIAQALASHIGEDDLSAREVEVLRHVALGRSNKRIGQELTVTEDTIKGHMKAILAKLGASDRTHAVTLALQRGIIEL
jgi:two-component system NarL family response regulator